MVAAGRAALGLIGDEMTPPTARKAKPQGPPAADDAVELLRELVALQCVANEHLAAIRIAVEAKCISEPSDSSLIDRSDLITVKQAAGLVPYSEMSIRRAIDKYGIGERVVNEVWVFRSKLLAHFRAPDGL